MDKTYKAALVIGGGAFGTSVANLISESFERVYILVRSKDVFDSINSGENGIYLPGKLLNKNISAILSFSDLSDQEEKIELIVSGLPTAAIIPFFSTHHSEIEKLLIRKSSSGMFI